jgi:hypothetical protein
MMKMAGLTIVTLAGICGPSWAATPQDTDQPVCAQGTWAMQGNEQKYVCLAWRFRGQVYSLLELEQVLTQLNPASPPLPQANPQPSGEPPPRTATPASIPSMSVTISFPCDIKNSLKALLD